MIDIWTFVWEYAFFQRALLGGVFVALLCAFMGVFVVLRQSSFFGEAIAHSSLTGVAIGLLLGFNPLLAAAGYAMLVAFVLPYLQKTSRLSTDNLLGLLLPFSVAVGVLLLTYIPGYQPELISYLFGSILSIGWQDIWLTGGLIVLVVVVMVWSWKQMVMVAFDKEYARAIGMPVERLDVLYHVLLALTVVVGIKLVGVILVNALLIMPASAGRLWTTSLKQLFWVAPLLSLFITVIGLFLSLQWHLPTGPTLVVIAGVVFGVSLGGKVLVSKR